MSLALILIRPSCHTMFPKAQPWLQYCSFCTRSLSLTTLHVLHHMFADDTELYKSVSRDKIPSLLNAMQRCVADVKLWTIQNKLQLSEDKTEALLTSLFVSAILPLHLKIGHSDIQFADSARNLGVMFDNKLSMKVRSTIFVRLRTSS